MSVIIFTAAQLLVLTSALGGLVWKRAHQTQVHAALQPARVRR
ncbi:MAG: hypothetical protein ACE37B_04170 [Ilumatobacter sp.]|jgi:hypothetical protein